MEKNMKHYFTFGQGHVHPETGELMKDYWIEVHNKTHEEAMKLMFNAYGQKWSFQYDELEFCNQLFPNGCYEILGGDDKITYSMKRVTPDEAIQIIQNKLL